MTASKASGRNERETERLKSSLRRKERTVEALRAQAEEQEKSFAVKLAEKEEQLKELSQRISQRDEELESIRSSLGWRILSRYGLVKHRIILPLLRALRLKPRPNSLPDALRLHISREIPDRIDVGYGTALYIAGWCFHPDHRIKKLQLAIDGVPQPMKATRMAAPEVLRLNFPDHDPHGYSYRSGFWAILQLPRVEEPRQVNIEVHAVLSGGAVVSRLIAAPILESGCVRNSPTAVAKDSDTNEPLIAICMTTFNPPINLFARQVQSIINQTHSNWVCYISDDNSLPGVYEQIAEIAAGDSRFHLRRNARTLGFYRNFEACLSLVSEDSEFVALCDHDDYWYPGKLAVLLSEFDRDTTLVYSDMNIVNDDGEHLSGTYWTTRRNNYENFASLIFANTITGAASMIPRRLLGLVLPFPEGIGEAYHDHWIGCVAMAEGELKYVDRPLYDYVQHSSNVLGHFAPDKETLFRGIARFLSDVRTPKKVIRHNLVRWSAIYFSDLLRLQLNSRVLLARCTASLNPARVKTLRRVSAADESFFAFAWLWIRSLRNIGSPSETLGAENRLVMAVVWKRLFALKSWFGSWPFVRRFVSVAPPQSQPVITGSSPVPQSEATVTDEPPVAVTRSESAAEEEQGPYSDEAIDAEAGSAELAFVVDFIRQRTAPLSLDVSGNAPHRINLLIPMIDSRYIFGGYITKFNLALRLAEAGFDTRIVVVDPGPCPPEVWSSELQGFPGLGCLFDNVETANAADRSVPLEVSPDDVFIATTWWTAHVARQAVLALGKERFIYLIQEYEPFTHPMGTFASLASQTYTFPHYAIFSTEFLRDYFRQNSLGVFAEACGMGETNSVSFQNTITSVGEITAADLSDRHPRKLLLYARPEPHAARNMFEIAVLAISQAVKKGYFDAEWEFYGIGTVGPGLHVPLSDEITMQLLPRQSQDSYRDVLRSHDLGMSLMYTPHPSLVPIEMASAGMLVVTNTYANKTRDKLTAISTNLIGAEPEVDALSLALRDAVSKIDDYESRVRGSRVAWSKDWEEAFNPQVWNPIERFIESIRSRAGLPFK